jgi:hypothetical protein
VNELLIPELQKRGIFWNDYHVPGGTYRENLYEIRGQNEPPSDHPAAAKIWRAPPDELLTNGVQESKSQTNGWHEEDEEKLDPMAMQLS